MARTGLQFDAGALPYNYKSGALAASGVIVNDGPVRLYGVVISNSSASAIFVQLFDSASVPADTTVPDEVVTVPGNSTWALWFGADPDRGGRSFSNGLSWAVSTTLATKTLGSAVAYVTAKYH